MISSETPYNGGENDRGQAWKYAWHITYIFFPVVDCRLNTMTQLFESFDTISNRRPEFQTFPAEHATIDFILDLLQPQTGGIGEVEVRFQLKILVTKSIYRLHPGEIHRSDPMTTTASHSWEVMSTLC